MSYCASGAFGEDPAPRQVTSETEAIYRVGEEQYQHAVELQRRRLSRIRFDWRFWIGLVMAAAGGAAIYFKPDIGAAGGRARRRISRAADPVVSRSKSLYRRLR